MIDFINDHILTLMIFLPFVVGNLILITPISHKLGSLLSLISSSLVMLLAIDLFINFQGTGFLEFKEKVSVIESYGISYIVGVDGVSLMILMIVAFSFPTLHFILKSEKKGYWANMLLMQSAFMAVILAEDLIFFYAGWEAMLLPIFVMIGFYGKAKDKSKAAMKMMYYTMFGSLFMFLAIAYLGVLHFEQFGYYSFELSSLKKLYLTSTESFWLFVTFMLAFAIKTPLFPLHMWMPDAYVKAPAGATFALSAIASKVAVFAILRFVLPLFPAEFVQYAYFFVALGIFSMIYFAIAAIAQTDIKRILAYSSASHLGLIIAGIFGLNYQSMVGGIYQIIAHAMATGILFLLVGRIARELKTRDINELGGLATKAPVFAFFFGVALVSSVGLPGTNGFIGEFLILMGTFKFDFTAGLFATSSVIVGAIYMFLVYRKAILQSVNERTKHFTDLSKKEILAFIPVVVFIFIMGIYPKPFLKRIEPTVNKQFELYIKPHVKEVK